MSARLLPLAGFVALIGLLSFGIVWNLQHDQREVPSPLIGRAAPAFTLPQLYVPETFFSNTALYGRPYLLNVFGSWCPACQEEHPVLMRYAKSLGVTVVGFNWKDEATDAQHWLAQFGNPYDVIVVDNIGRTAIDFGVYGAPETFLVDADGTVRLKRIGPLTPDYIERELKPTIATLGKMTP